MTEALAARGGPIAAARLAAELDLLAFGQGYAAWVEADDDDAAGLEPYALAALDELRAAARTLG